MLTELNWLRSKVLVEVRDDCATHQESETYIEESESRFVQPIVNVDYTFNDACQLFAQRFRSLVWKR